MTSYRPILRFKRGEQTALSNLFEGQKASTKPILNLTAHSYSPPEGSTVDKAFDLNIIQDANRLNAAWADYYAAVDLGDIDPDARCEGGIHPLRKFFDQIASSDEKAKVSPVIRLSNDADYISSVASICSEFKVGPVFRLTPDDLADPDISEVISELLAEFRLSAADSEMIVDMSYITTTGRSIITAKGALSAVPFTADWASLILVAGSFPENLSGFSVGTHTVDRHEWSVWIANRKAADRDVLYGDYATIHPIPVDEELDPRTMNPTASARYTHENTWILLRGQGTRTRGGPGFSQFYDHADKLCKMAQYRGEPFSYGDKKIARINRREDSQGNLETWVTVGVNHHIAEIVDQLANLA